MHRVTPEERRAVQVAFALQVVGGDYIAETPTPDSLAARMVQREPELRAAGITGRELADGLDALLHEDTD